MQEYLKHLSFLIFFQSAVFVNGKYIKFTPQKLVLNEPEDVGFGHSEIIHDLQGKLGQRQPGSGREYLQFISLTMMDHFCEFANLLCNQNMADLTSNIVVGPQGDATTGFEHLRMNLLPEDFDPQVLTSLQQLFESVSLADLQENPKDIIFIMNNKLEELKTNENVEDENHRLVGLVTYSVGIESLKQWFEILNDQNNPYFLMLTSLTHGRKLQADQVLNSLSEEALENIDFTKLIEADMIGAAAGAIAAVFDNSGNILSNALTEASLTSLTQVASGIVSVGEVTGCLFPGTPLCTENPVDPTDPESDCLFPNSLCIPIGNNGEDNTGNTDEPNNLDNPDESNNPDNPDCLLPNSLCIPIGNNGENNPDNPEEPSNPTEDSQNESNEENPTSPENPSNNVNCLLFPNSESCNPDTENNEDGENNASLTLPTFCDLFPNTSGCSN